MDQVSIDRKLVVLGSLVCKDNFKSNLGTEIFVIRKRAIDEYE